ncbi:MAG: DUF4174 domain-containing protein [Paracoccus sp. (in: a-proteobacteria)]|nr:DUF4174 domain-containing protein [Paracoccus sp. (in: a-proteobacteria)]
MRHLILILAVFAVAAMGPGRSTDAPPRERVNPPSAAEVSERQAQTRPDAAPAPAGDLRVIDAADALPQDFLWTARPVVVFANTADDPAFVQQMREFQQSPRLLVERDVIIVTDTDPAAQGPWRIQLRPRGFSLVVMDKDGEVKQRKPAPWSVREISRAIDRFELRRQEIGRAGTLP